MNLRDFPEEPLGSIWHRASSEDLCAIARSLLNTLGASLFLAGSGTNYDASRAGLTSLLFVCGNCAYIATGIWWALATYHEFESRYMPHAAVSLLGSYVGSPTTAGFSFSDPSHECLFYSRPLMVAGPGSVPPPFAALPPRLESREIIHAFQALCWLDVFGALCQVSGSVLFTVGCAVSCWTDATGVAVAFWCAGSSLFVLQGIIGHIMCTSLIGTWLTLIPRTYHYRQWLLNNTPDQFPACCKKRESGDAVTSSYMHIKNACVHKCIPAALFNTLGSLLFFCGSLSLAFDIHQYVSVTLYLIGSTLFLVSNYSDGANIIDELYRRVTHEDKH